MSVSLNSLYDAWSTASLALWNHEHACPACIAMSDCPEQAPLGNAEVAACHALRIAREEATAPQPAVPHGQQDGRQ